MNNRFLRWGVYLMIAIAFAMACVFLSNWQFERNEGRAEQIALVERNYDAEPIPLADIISTDDELEAGDEWHPVLLRGEYLTDDQTLVRNRPHGGTSAFEVLVPFRDVDGRIFIVNRGWAAPGEGALPDFIAEPPSGTVEVVVRLRPSEPLPTSGRSAPDGQVPTIHLPSIAEELTDEETITSAYGLLVSESPTPKESLGGFESPTDDPGPHLSYAIQWILFGIMGFIFIFYMIRTEVQKNREEAEGRPAPVKKARRRDHDADAEDELLDDVATRV